MTSSSALTGVLALCLLAGCGEEGGGSATRESSPPKAGSLADAVGVHYVSTGVTVDGNDYPLAGGSQLKLFLDEESVQFSADCNSMSGAYKFDGDRLVVRAVGGTEMGCPPDLMRQEDLLTRFLSSGPEARLEGDRLTLASEDTVVSMLDVESAEPALPLRNTTWVLDSYGGSDPDGTVASVPSEVRSTLLLRGRKILADQGCNGAGGAYILAGNTLRVRRFATQLELCPEERMMVEDAVQRVLTSRPTVAIDGDVLTLTGGGRTLTYRAR